MTSHAPRGAVLGMACGAALISTTSIFVRWAHVAPTVSAFYRMFFGGSILLLMLLVRRQLRFALADVLWLALPALAIAGDLMLWHRSIRDIGPGLATLIANFQVFIMAIAGVVFYRERLHWRFLVGVAMALVGLWLLVGVGWSSFTPQFRIGVYFGLLTGVAYAIYLLTLRQAQLHRARLTPMQALCLSTVLSAVVLAVAVAVEGDSFAIPDAQTWSSLLGLALFGQVIGWMVIVRAMPRLPASLVGLLLLLQPALSFVLDVVLFGRETSGFDWLGLGLSLVGIFAGSVRAAR